MSNRDRTDRNRSPEDDRPRSQQEQRGSRDGNTRGGASRHPADDRNVTRDRRPQDDPSRYRDARSHDDQNPFGRRAQDESTRSRVRESQDDRYRHEERGAWPPRSQPQAIPDTGQRVRGYRGFQPDPQWIAEYHVQADLDRRYSQRLSRYYNRHSELANLNEHWDQYRSARDRNGNAFSMSVLMNHLDDTTRQHTDEDHRRRRGGRDHPPDSYSLGHSSRSANN